MDPRALEFSSSLSVDRQLYDEDIRGSIAHVSMLGRRKIIPAAAARSIIRALKQIRREMAGEKPAAYNLSDTRAHKKQRDRFVDEDIHMAIESRLMARLGEAGGRLHTARSRNDQIALDERLYLQKAIALTTARIRALQRVLVKLASQHQKVLMPGYTHLQRAQPILFGHHVLAYVEMLDRDYERFLDGLRRAAKSPLGSGALAGTSFSIDRAAVAKELGLEGIVENSIDAVSDRDALLEFIASAAITMMHLSRLAEELVLWSSREWNFIEISDAFATGSSIMPQKKNPDMAELVRGKTGRVYGDLVALLTVMKGLPLAYNRDMQEDKEPLFDAADTLAGSLQMMALMLQTMTVHGDRFEAELKSDFLVATELADYLVRKGLPFRKAHALVGSIVQHCEQSGATLQALPLETYRTFSPLFGADAMAALGPRASLTAKQSAGSTSPAEVSKALRRWKKKLQV
ncbi:argininosuccinate lyase [bacterium]|nr:MAG: argininosuccinate lyase [bacterium]